MDPRSEDDIRVPIEECEFRFTVKPSLMEVVQAINPGQSLIPEWVHQGAILGVQGGTKRMLDILNQVAYYPLTMLTSTEKIISSYNANH